MRQIQLLLVLAVSMLSIQVTAQESWSLQKCVSYAQQNSLSIRQAQNSIRNAELTQKQNQLSRLPSVDGTISGGLQFGRTIDPVSNDFNNQRIGFNSYQLSAGATVFNGNRINNSIKQSKLDLTAAKLDADFTSDNLGLDIANAYLNILLAEEQLEIARRRLEQSQSQLEQTDKLIQAGGLPENDRLDFLSQIALDEQSIIEAENLVEQNYLNLKQLMNVDPNTPFQIDRPDIDIPADWNPDQFQLEEVYTSALSAQSNIQAGDIRLKSAELDEKIAQAGYMPRLTVFGSLNSNYSDQARMFTSQETIVEQDLTLNGQPVTIGFPQTIGIPQDYPYFDQISDNFGQSLGASINIPIYSNHQNKIATERARLGVINQEVQNQQLRQQLKSNVQRAIAGARSSKRSYEAAQRAEQAASMAFQNAQRRFDLGAINSLEFSTARLNLDQARIEIARARYSYIFNVKQVEFYMGKEISL